MQLFIVLIVSGFVLTSFVFLILYSKKIELQNKNKLIEDSNEQNNSEYQNLIKAIKENTNAIKKCDRSLNTSIFFLGLWITILFLGFGYFFN
jgi:hypothetical protein